MEQGFIPNDWEGEYCRYAVCWPNSPQWLAVLRGVLTLPAQGRYWDKFTGTITEAQAVIRETFDYNLRNYEVIMACNDTGLAEIAAAIALLANNGCCGTQVPVNGGVQATVDIGGVNVAIYGSEPPLSLPPDEVPEGYPGTREEYDSDKCRSAAAIVEGFADSLDAFSYFNWFASTISIAAIIGMVAGLIVVPEFMIPVLIAAVIANVGITAAMRELAVQVRGDFNADLICALYEANNAGDAIGAFLTILGAAIAALEVSGPIGVGLSVVGQVLMNTDTANTLFSLKQGYGPEFDCLAGCSEGTVVAVNNDSEICTVEQLGPDLWEVQAVLIPGEDPIYEAVFGFNTDENLTSFTGPMLIASEEVTGGSISGTPHGIAYHRVFNQSYAQIYSGDAAPEGVCGAYWVVLSDTDFTLQITIEEAC